jgi:hypothetical protein
MIFRDLIKNGSRFATENAPAILTAFGVVGTVTTAVLTGKASFDAAQRLADAEFTKNVKEGFEAPEPTTFDKVKIVWPCYIPAVFAGATTVGAIIFAHRVSSRRAMAIALAYAASEGRLEEYQDKVKEKFGIKKETEVRDELAADRVNRDAKGIVFGGVEGKVLCHDAYSGRFFWSTIETVNKAVNDVNREILQNDSATISDFYDAIDASGLDHTSLSDEMGWNAAESLSLAWTQVASPNGGPAAHSFDFESRPILRPWNSASFR